MDLNFKIESVGDKRYLIYRLQDGDRLDSYTYKMLSGGKRDGLAEVTLSQFNDVNELRYDITGCRSLKERESSAIAKNNLMRLLSALLDAMRSLKKDYNIEAESLVLSSALIFICNDVEPHLICLPLLANEKRQLDYVGFLLPFLETVPLGPGETADYRKPLISYLKRPKAFVPAEFKAMLDQTIYGSSPPLPARRDPPSGFPPPPQKEEPFPPPPIRQRPTQPERPVQPVSAPVQIQKGKQKKPDKNGMIDTRTPWEILVGKPKKLVPASDYQAVQPTATPVVDDRPMIAITVPPSRNAYLLRRESGERIWIDSTEFRIGQAPDNNLVIANKRLSHHHAKIRFSEATQRFMLEDTGSLNHTRINGQTPLKPNQPQPLLNGVQLMLANELFDFILDN